MKESFYSRDFTSYQKKIMDFTLDAFKQDYGLGDVTTDALLEGAQVRGEIRAKEACVVCGLIEARTLFESAGIVVNVMVDEGEEIDPGSLIITLIGNSREIIGRARTALDYLKVMSGIATKTRALDKKYPKKIATTRKSHPGLLLSEKRAVTMGGGFAHRINLSDGYLVKKEHLVCFAFETYGFYSEEAKLNAMGEALKRISIHREITKNKHLFVEVEVTSLEEAMVCLNARKQYGIPHILMIDNKNPDEFKKIVQEYRKEEDKFIQTQIPNVTPEMTPDMLDEKRTIIEASGRISEENIEKYIKAGADVVSMSDLVLNAKPIDISMEIAKGD